jgi:hypothetical protein
MTMLEWAYDDLQNTISELKALNAELLAALIQMEQWCGLLAMPNFSTELGHEVSPDGTLTQDLAIARAVIAKAMELEQ